MLYAKEVMALLGAHPGRQFRMREIRRYVECQMNIPETDTARREAVRQGVVRVIDELVSTGTVRLVKPPKNRRNRLYMWKLSTLVVT